MEASAPRPDLRRFAVGGAQLSMIVIRLLIGYWYRFIIRIGYWYRWGGLDMGLGLSLRVG